VIPATGKLANRPPFPQTTQHFEQWPPVSLAQT
jgi:hypothetical protein